MKPTIVELQKRIAYLEERLSDMTQRESQWRERAKEMEKSQEDLNKELVEQVKWLRSLVSSTFAREVTITKNDGTVIEKTWSSPIEETTYRTFPMRGMPRY